MGNEQYTNVVTVFNRSNHKVEFTWDGRHFEVPPATAKGPGTTAMLEPAAWHGRKVSVYNLSVYSLIGVPVLGIVGIHDSELSEEMPEPSATGELLDRKEIEINEGLATPDVRKFSSGPMLEPKAPDSGRVVFSADREAPFKGGISVTEEASE